MLTLLFRPMLYLLPTVNTQSCERTIYPTLIMLPTPANAASCANQGRVDAGTAMLPLTSGKERMPSLVRQPFSSSTSSGASDPPSLPEADAGALGSAAGKTVTAATRSCQAT